MKNCMRPHYEKLKPLKSGFIENSNFENNRDPCHPGHNYHPGHHDHPDHPGSVTQSVLQGQVYHRFGIFEKMNDDELKNYLAKISDEALYAYNVYQIEGEGRNLFSSIDGNENTIMGLPVEKIKKYLNNYKWKNI